MIVSDHCTGQGFLVREKLIEYQLSQRGGILKCKDALDKVKKYGKAKLFFKGELYLD